MSEANGNSSTPALRLSAADLAAAFHVAADRSVDPALSVDEQSDAKEECYAAMQKTRSIPAADHAELALKLEMVARDYDGNLSDYGWDLLKSAFGDAEHLSDRLWRRPVDLPLSDRDKVQDAVTAELQDEGKDADVIRFAREFREKDHRSLELIEKCQLLTPELPCQGQEEILSLMRAKQELAEAIADRRSTTVAGLRAKAAVLLAYSQYDIEGNLHWTDHDELMGWSLARDLLGDGAAQPHRFGIGGRASAAHPGPAPTASPAPDHS